MPGGKTRQISVRIPAELDEWLQNRAGQEGKKADVVRTLIEDAMTHEKEEQLLAIFNEAARDLTEEDRQERELVTGAFTGANRGRRRQRKRR